MVILYKQIITKPVIKFKMLKKKLHFHNLIKEKIQLKRYSNYYYSIEPPIIINKIPTLIGSLQLGLHASETVLAFSQQPLLIAHLKYYIIVKVFYF